VRRLPQGQQGGRHSFTHIRVGNRHAVGERFQFGARLVDRDTLLEARDADHIAVVAIAEHPFLNTVEQGLLHVGYPEIEAVTGSIRERRARPRRQQ